MKPTLILIAAILLSMVATVGSLPAQDINRDNFNLIVKNYSKVDNNTELFYLKAKIKELEEENTLLKKKIKDFPRDFGIIYLTDDGKLRCKDTNGDWDWNGKIWHRGNEIVPSARPEVIVNPLQYYVFPQQNCPNGQCPFKK
jgi:hypothetical protein